MTTKEFQDNINKTFQQCLRIVEVKNQDYANSANPFKNFESASVIGLDVQQAILLRILDKIARVGNLIHRAPSVKDESVEDTLNDLINYAAILKAYRENLSGTRKSYQSRDTGSESESLRGVKGASVAL